MTEPEYTIQDLSELSGVPRRTIHFYIQQGIIPPPQSAGLGARYSSLHLVRLKALPVFRRRGLRLDEIRIELEKMDLEALLQLAGQEMKTEQKPFQTASVPVSTTFQRFTYSGGIEIIASAGLSSGDRRRLESLLQSANQIFSK